MTGDLNLRIAIFKHLLNALGGGGRGGAVLAYQEKLFIKTNVNDLGNKLLHSHSPPPFIIIIVIILIKHNFFWMACCSLP